mmetsp:Transcript_24806/g.62380  ORF Transcript_24806/g.62380 Transcript_24806/m.62380 type:complete len:215 (+) Transcript_24806:183-827(+)
MGVARCALVASTLRPMISKGEPEGSSTLPPASSRIREAAATSQQPPNPISKNASRRPIATPQMFIAQDPQARMDLLALLSFMMRSMMAIMVSKSRCTPISVATSALSSCVSGEAEMGRPFRYAPQPRSAVKVSPRMGLCTTPTTTCLLTTSATQVHTKGKECTKFVVPSSGSHIHVGASVSSGVRPACATSSSPIKAWSGNFSSIARRIRVSHA